MAHCSMDLYDLKVHPTLSFTCGLPDLLFRATSGSQLPPLDFLMSHPCVLLALGPSEEGEGCRVIESANLF